MAHSSSSGSRRHSTPSSPRPTAPGPGLPSSSAYSAAGSNGSAFSSGIGHAAPANSRVARHGPAQQGNAYTPSASSSPSPSPSMSPSPIRHPQVPASGSAHAHEHGQGQHRTYSRTSAAGAQAYGTQRNPPTPTSRSRKTAAAVAAVVSASSAGPSSAAHPTASSSSSSSHHRPHTSAPSHTYSSSTHTPATLHGIYGAHEHRRAPSATPSSTSVSEGEDEGVLLSSEMRAWALTGKGKGKQRQEGMEVDGEEGQAVRRPGRVGIEDLPPELLLHIFRRLPDSASFVPLLLVNRQWSLFAYPFIWQKPLLTSPVQFAAFVRVINSSSAHPSGFSSSTGNPSFHPYASAVKRLNLTSVASTLTDETFLGLRHCTRVERLTLSGTTQISASALKEVLACMPEIGSLDLSAGELEGAGDEVTDEVVRTVAQGCRKLQGTNLTRCHKISDEGVLEMASVGLGLKRIRLQHCNRLTDLSLCALLRSSPLLLEIDMANLPQMTNATVYTVFLNSAHVRELDMKGNVALTSEGFPNLPELAALDDAEWEEKMLSEPWKAKRPSLPVVSQGNGGAVGVWANTLNLPVVNPATISSATPSPPPSAQRWPGWPVFPDSPILRRQYAPMAYLRVVDLYGCTGLGDDAVRNLVASAPRLRNLTLAKCPNLTDGAIEAICGLGRHLQYLHLGHVAFVTDNAIIKLSKSCTRIRYLDLASCVLLTDLTVFELAANLPKLRRIGLVKVMNITDEAIHALAERHDSLERIHLSYCDKISVDAVTYLLNNLMSLTHLSLTGVSAFRKSELQQFCRPVPSNFNTHQRETFCVYSDMGIHALRNHLNSKSADAVAESDSSVHTRRNSASSTSSITIPGGPTEDGEGAEGDVGRQTDGGNTRYRSGSSAGAGLASGAAGAWPTGTPQSLQAPYRDISLSRLSPTRGTGTSRQPQATGAHTGSNASPSSPGRATAMFATLALPPTVPRTPPPPELTTPSSALFGAHAQIHGAAPALSADMSPSSSMSSVVAGSSSAAGGGSGPRAGGASAGPNLSVYHTNIDRPPEALGPYFSYLSSTPISHSTRAPGQAYAGGSGAAQTRQPAWGAHTGAEPSASASPTSGMGSTVGKTGSGKRWFASLGRWGGSGSEFGGIDGNAGRAGSGGGNGSSGTSGSALEEDKTWGARQ